MSAFAAWPLDVNGVDVGGVAAHVCIGWCNSVTINHLRNKLKCVIEGVRVHLQDLQDSTAVDSSKPLAICDGDAESDKGSSGSGSTSNSSSSDSSNHRKKSKKKSSKKSKGSGKKHGKDKKSKKSKKSKKDKKKKGAETAAERKERLAKERDQEKANIADVKAAQLILKKIETPLLSLRALMTQKNFNLVAPSIRDPLEMYLKKFSDLQLQAEAVVIEGEGRVDADVKSLAMLVGQLRSQMALATSMLALIERGSHATK